MTYESIKTEMIGLPEDKINQVVEFIRFLKFETGSLSLQQAAINDSVSNPKTPKRTFGSMASKITYVAPDFDSCLDGLEDYV